MSITHTEITQLGLDEKQAKVYIASLTLGQATVEQLAKSAGILRTTTYNQISALQEIGLMSTVQIGKKTYYLPEAPTNLTRFLHNQEATVQKNQLHLSKLLPELTALFTQSGERPAVRYFPHKEGLLTMREEVLQMQHKELLVVTAYDAFSAIFTPEERRSFTKRRQERDIDIRVLFSSSLAPVATEQMKSEEVRPLPSGHLPLGFDIYIYDDKVCLSSLAPDNIWGVMIIGQAVKQSVHMLFEIAWQAAAKQA